MFRSKTMPNLLTLPPTLKRSRSCMSGTDPERDPKRQCLEPVLVNPILGKKVRIKPVLFKPIPADECMDNE